MSSSGERLPWLAIGDELPRHDTLPRGVPRVPRS